MENNNAWHKGVPTQEQYEEAVKEKYRFFSFGDAMFIQQKNDILLFYSTI